MPLQVLQFRPGISRESTNLANEGGWYDCDKIRFRSGLPEKLNGWQNFTPQQTFLGTCRKLTDWESLSNFYLLAIGTDVKFYTMVGTGGVYYDITPVRYATVLGSNPFSTVYTTLATTITSSTQVGTISVASAASFSVTLNTSYVIQIGTEQLLVNSVNSVANTVNIVQRGYNGTTATTHAIGAVITSSYLIVADAGNGAAVGDYVTFSGSVTTFGPYTGLILLKQFKILSVGTGAAYVIDTGVQSTSAISGGGATVTATYQINTGEASTTSASGWGECPWPSVAPTVGATTIATVLNSTATTITVVDTSSFAASGQIQIGSEYITYSGKTSTTFTGCTRAPQNPTSHGVGTAVIGVEASNPTLYNSTWGFSSITGNSQVRIWSADNFGQNLVYNYRNGPIFYWDASTKLSSVGKITGPGIYLAGGSTGATNLTTDTYAPTLANWVFVTDQRYIVALGVACPAVTVGGIIGAQDPMAISWCDQGNPAVWTPTATNTAGSYRLGYGSKIVTAEKTRQETLVFTDSALISMQYTGAPYVYGFYTISTDTTIAGPNAVATTNGITYWMGQGKFYVYSGRVDTLPCALRQYVFDDINLNPVGADQVYAGTNDRYNEIWWFYCSKNSVVPDKYVIYNYLEKLWYYGTMNRTAWLDSHIQGYPWATSSGQLVQHESSLNDGINNPPTAINAYLESADFDIGDADKFSFVKRIIPDVDFIGSNTSNPYVTMTIAARDFPGQGLDVQTNNAGISGSPQSITSSVSQIYNYTNQVYIRIRGRQVAFRIESNELDVKWQLGVPRLEVQPDGRRS